MYDLDNPTLDLRPMQQLTVSIQALIMLRDEMAFEKVLCCGRFNVEKPQLPEGCRCLADLQTYQLQEITGRSDFPRDLLLILARYLVQRQYAVENGQTARFKTAGELTASFIHSYSHRQIGAAADQEQVVKPDTTPKNTKKRGSQSPQNGEGKAIYLRYHLPSTIRCVSPLHPNCLAPLRGQGLLIRDWIWARSEEEALNPFTHQEVTDCLVRHGFTCNQDPYRAIRWVLDEWVKKGYLVKK